MQLFNRHFAIALVALGLATGAGTAAAQSGQSQSQNYSASQASAKNIHVSNSQVQKFAKAKHQVLKIQSQWQSKIQHAKDKKTRQQYQKQADQQMVKAVRKTGLSVKQYNRIAQASRSDSKLAKRIRQANG